MGIPFKHTIPFETEECNPSLSGLNLRGHP